MSYSIIPIQSSPKNSSDKLTRPDKSRSAFRLFEWRGQMLFAEADRVLYYRHLKFYPLCGYSKI